MKLFFNRAAFALILMFFLGSILQAELVNIPNASFEMPETEFADPNISEWQDAPKPWWYDESGGYYWEQLTGFFRNVGSEDPAHIDNCDGNQAAWLFAVPQVELFQDLEAVFQIGRIYRLKVGIIGGGGNMKDDVPIELRLYYRDAEDNKVAIDSTAYSYDLSSGYIKHFNDIVVEIPPVKEGDPWAGKSIGVQLVSTLVFPDDLDPESGRAGGYWDLDNFRLTAVSPDFSSDCFVDMEDFALMAQNWLSCSDASTDLTDEGCVSAEDMEIFAGYWLENVCR
ncbi:hypothetical protein SMSP2_02225 [Limihaloglobus sulfuriphilus]|uniref:Uncharacterized protein n=1 Tax=Limihaloglobus sulfuriphilus TaxID=1851148 RepID=A0A1R7T5V6_9BACT|nr:hypothetical protein [Limihaloglobus sulfuriphilus]AQQ71846.1 hypothetical protein SMSP2_02225 [Limihaloglobus sulfuriphilus]